MKQRTAQSGFGTVVILIILVVVAVAAVSGLEIYQHHKSVPTKKVAAATSTQTTRQPVGTTTTQPAQPAYAAWPVYSNTKYGFSYNYPTDWAPSGDVANNPNTSATRQEFSTGLKLNTDTKYNDTVVFEVLDEPLQTAKTWYDQSYAQSSIKVNTATNSLMGKQSVQYDFKAPTYESKRYLFAVGSKTYLFESVDEDVRARDYPNYWSDFDNVISSLTIQ